jgi:flagellar L-ring protein FlgH
MMMIRTKHLGLLLVSTALLSACGASERLANIGKAPDLSPIVNPETAPDYKPVSLPMPREEEVVLQKNSLWASNRQTFFKDQRARKIGDILTVTINIADDAKLDNKTERKRTSAENATMPAMAGFEQKIDSVLPDGADPTDLVNASGSSNHKGEGKVDRKEDINMQMAAMITQILPNGNMVINGRQEVRVNFENRILELMGVIRPEDIDPNNKISYEKIAEARVSYGGKGQMTDVQQPRYGQQLYDVVFPF